MYKSTPRRNTLILRGLTYLIMTIAVIALAVLSLFLVLGYTLNQKTGRAEQGGLIQFRSSPDSANIRVDGKTQGFNTSGKLTANATTHDVTIFKPGYRDWNKSFTLGRGELLWLNALLVPSSVTTSEAEHFDGVSQMIASPDKKRLAVLEKANTPLIKIIDISDEKNPKMTTLKIPDTVVGPVAPTDTFAITEWDFGGRYALVKHTSGTITQWLRLDRTDEDNAQNITTKLKLTFTELHFAGTSGSAFYGVSDGELRKLDVSQTTLPTPIATNVSQFELYGDNSLAFVSQKSDQQIIWVDKGSDPPTKVETLMGLQPPAEVSLTQFFGDYYLAVSQGHVATIFIHPFDSKKIVTKMSLPTDITWLYFSSNGQFLIAQQGSFVDSYNLERNLNTQFTIPGGAPYTSPTHLAWIDDFHFWSDAGGTLRIFEFDGTNAQIISNVIPGQDVTLSSNGKRLFSIGTNTTTNQPVLQSSVMVIE